MNENMDHRTATFAAKREALKANATATDANRHSKALRQIKLQVDDVTTTLHTESKALQTSFDEGIGKLREAFDGMLAIVKLPFHIYSTSVM